MAYFIASMVSTPNFNAAEIDGWTNRVIFSQNIPTDVNLTGGNNYFTNIPPIITRGTLGRFPRNYWKQGRTLRLKASLLYSGNGSKLDIVASLDDSSNSIIARPNNGNSHNFVAGNAANNVPINLEITYVRGGDDNALSISGFYQYEWGSYDSGGDNSKVVYVPITFINSNVLDFTSQTQMGLYVDNEIVTINWLTVEELG